MLKILLMTGDAGEAQEIYYAKYRLEEEGWQVHITAPEKRAFLSVVHDFEPGFDTYTEKPGYRVEADLGLTEVDPTSYDALVLPGGRAPEYLRNRPSRRRHRSPLRRGWKTDCGELPWSAALDRGRRSQGENDDVLPRAELDLRAAGRKLRQPRRRRRRPARHGTGMAGQRPLMREFVRILKAKTGAGSTA